MIKFLAVLIFSILSNSGRLVSGANEVQGEIVDPSRNVGGGAVPTTTEEIIYFVTTPVDRDDIEDRSTSRPDGKFAKRPLVTQNPAYQQTTDDYDRYRRSTESPYRSLPTQSSFYARRLTTPKDEDTDDETTLRYSRTDAPTTQSSVYGRRTTDARPYRRYTTPRDDETEEGTTEYAPSWRRTTFSPFIRTTPDSYRQRYGTTNRYRPLGRLTTESYRGRGQYTTEESRGSPGEGPTSTCKLSAEARSQFGQNVCSDFINCCQRQCAAQDLQPKGNCKHDTETGFDTGVTYCSCRNY